jgi:ABC-2 type transport system ATP-binding protein
VALDGLDVSVRPGTVVGLVGPNGCGKTTALHAVAGLTRLDAGSALVAGARAGTIEARRRLALIPDEPTGFDELTVAEHVTLLHSLHAAGDVERERANVLLDAFGLDSRRGTPLGALSRGLRRQASLVSGLSLGRPLTLVDEATAALDPEAVVVLRVAVEMLARSGCGVLVATQDLAFAEIVCDEIVLVSRGRVIASGTVSELIGRHGADSLEKTFLDAIGKTSLGERVRERLGAL